MTQEITVEGDMFSQPATASYSQLQPATASYSQPA